MASRSVTRRLARLLVPEFADVAAVVRVVDDPAALDSSRWPTATPNRLRGRRWEGQRATRSAPSDVHRLLVDGEPQLVVGDVPLTFADVVGADLEDAPPAERFGRSSASRCSRGTGSSPD